MIPAEPRLGRIVGKHWLEARADGHFRTGGISISRAGFIAVARMVRYAVMMSSAAGRHVGGLCVGGRLVRRGILGRADRVARVSERSFVLRCTPRPRAQRNADSDAD